MGREDCLMPKHPSGEKAGVFCLICRLPTLPKTEDAVVEEPLGSAVVIETAIEAGAQWPGGTRRVKRNIATLLSRHFWISNSLLRL